MAKRPAHPKIYHITHLRNLPQIVEAGKLWSDAKRLERRLDCDVVGMSHIKKRRLEEIEVDCHPGTHVGDYVPFYLCPRSIMVFILHKGNHPDLSYSEGQGPIVHLEADLHAVVKWAEGKGRPWACSDRNAGMFYAKFFNDLAALDELNWAAIMSNSWSEASVKESKQAEFLVQTSFPWHLVERVGVLNQSARAKAEAAVSEADHQPVVSVQSAWYY